MSVIKPTEISYIDIFPPIGIARVGNSKEHYIGPEIPGCNATPDAGTENEGFKDKDMKVKRQAARFRAYAFGKNHEVLGELNSDNGFELQWTVEVANKKPSWYTFMGRNQPGAFQPGNTTLRNPTVQPALHPDQRTDCIIAPGPKTIRTGSNETVDMIGQFKGSAPAAVDVYLGSIKVDDKGRLLVLPGHGLSRCIDNPEDPYPLILTDFDNPNWVDDTCDGTVQVKVTQGKYGWAVAHTAHVVCTTPKFASAIYAPTTLYDVMENVYAKAKGKGNVDNVVGEVEYWRDIWELIQRPVLLSWVNGQANGGHGPGRMGNFFDPEWQEKLQSRSPEHEATRKIILGRMRLPEIDNTEVARRGQAFQYFMPWLSGDGGRATEGDNTTFSSVTELQYARLKKWADGDFVVNPNNRPNPPTRFEDIPPRDQPVALTRANLEWTIGAPLYPGIELSWNAEESETYDVGSEALALGPLGFRINKSVKPGELTRYLSLPWQSDFYMCRNYWWPSARPDAILSQKVLNDVTEKYGWKKIVEAVNLSQKKNPSEAADALANHVPWERGIHQNYTDVYSDQPLFANTDMAQNWHKLGFIVRVDPPVQNLLVQGQPTLPIFVETQREHPHPEEKRPQGGVQRPELPVFALHSQALASFDAHTNSQKIEFRMPQPDNPATTPEQSPDDDRNAVHGKWGIKFNNPPITTLDSLKRHLHFAMAIELSTIPLYLYAMYSIKLPADKIKDPRFYDPVTDAIRSVVAEEMLHLSLAGNVLKAIGGVPKLYAQTYEDIKIFPTYGMEMPGRVPTLEMNLRKATKPNFDTFLGIELPQGRDDPPGGADKYHTLGQFYEALKDGLQYLEHKMGEKLFHQDSLPYQFAPGTGYQPRIQNAGGSIVVKDLKTALNALGVIVEQGEGRDGGEHAGDELAHYYVFQGLKEGTQTWEVYNVPENPTTEMYAKLGLKQIYQVSRTFDAAYCYLLLSIEKLWTIRDEDERRTLVLANMYSLMLGVLAPLAKLLVTQPLNDDKDRVAAPCFNWYEFTPDKGTPFKQLRAEMKTTMLSYVQVTAETDDQVVEHDFGAQIETLIPIQMALDNMLDIDTFERSTGKISKKGLNVAHTQGFKGFA